MKITQEQLETICRAFHKYWRVADIKNSLELWNAIDGIDDEDYGQAMRDALKEAGITVET